MKTIYHILLSGLLALLIVGCEPNSDVKNENPKLGNGQISFSVIGSRSDNGLPDEYGNYYSDKNIMSVPDTVATTIRKNNISDGTSEYIMKNAFFRITNYKSNNYLLLADSSVVTHQEGDPLPIGEQLCWYKTAHPAAYWDKSIDATYDFYSYAPVVNTSEANNYYRIERDTIIHFQIDKEEGIAVDFIYADTTGCTNANDADKLHLTYRHMLSKIVFKLKNSSENVVTCYGIKYKVKYPTASFNLVSGTWRFNNTSEEVDIKRYAQYEIFSGTEVLLPDLTTLLFPANSTSIESGYEPGNDIVVGFQVGLNNKWYDMTAALNALNLEYKEGRLIVLTFDCSLKYGDEIDGELFNIFAATFDSFENGEPIDGILK